MKGNVDGEEAKARLKARKRMMDCFSDTRNKRQLEQINFTHFTFAKTELVRLAKESITIKSTLRIQQ